MAWNPADKHADITLSLADVRAEDEFGSNFVWRSLRSLNSHNATEKVYFECEIIDDTGSGNGGPGFMPAAASLSDPAGADVNGYEYRGNGSVYNSNSGSAGQPTFTTGDNIAWAVNFITGKAWAFKNNVVVTAGGDPVTGANPTFSGISAAEVYFLAFGMKRTGYTADLFDTAALGTYSPPSGYVWADAPPAPATIGVSGKGVVISNGAVTTSADDDTDWYYQPAASSVKHTFTIRNFGGVDLNLTSTPRVIISGDTTEFTLDTDASTPVVPDGSTTFIIDFVPTIEADYTATITIANNDTEFTFAISGSGGFPDPGPGNNFADDSTAKVVYDFEDDPGFLNSTVGTLQTLTNHSDEPVIQDGVTFKVGSDSAFKPDGVTKLFQIYIENTDLDDGFPNGPLGSSSDFTICFWARSSAGNGVVVSMENFNTSANPVWRIVYTTDDILGPNIWIGNSSSGAPAYSEYLGSDTLNPVDVWVHNTLTYDFSEKAWTWHFYRADTGEKDTISGFSDQNPISQTTDKFNIYTGLSNTDEVVVFSEIKSQSEINEIVNGDFGGGLEAEINITGNTITIVNGDITPSETDGTDFGKAGIS